MPLKMLPQRSAHYWMILSGRERWRNSRNARLWNRLPQSECWIGHRVVSTCFVRVAYQIGMETETGMTRPDVACILTTYNRPRLVVDAIASVLEQDCDRWRLYIMDDGCDETTRSAIRTALPRDDRGHWIGDVATGYATSNDQITWWQGPQRLMNHRMASIPYSRTINVALNHLLEDEQYIAYLPDDDFFHTSSLRARPEYHDAHPKAHVIYGRSRSFHYDRRGV